MENLDEMLKRTVESVKHAVESDDIVGKPIVTSDGSVVLPVNRLSYGFVVGGGEYGDSDKNSDYPYTAACGGGVTITPVGFLVCGRDKKFISADKSESSSKWLDLLKGVADTLKEE